MIPESLRASLFTRLRPGALSGHLFADLCDRLLIAEAKLRGYSLQTTSDRSGDYLGLDAFADASAAGNFEGSSGRVGFHYKFVPSESAPLSSDHRSQIQDALRRATTGNNPRVDTLVLITPENWNRPQAD